LGVGGPQPCRCSGRRGLCRPRIPRQRGPARCWWWVGGWVGVRMCVLGGGGSWGGCCGSSRGSSCALINQTERHFTPPPHPPTNPSAHLYRLVVIIHPNHRAARAKRRHSRPADNSHTVSQLQQTAQGRGPISDKTHAMRSLDKTHAMQSLDKTHAMRSQDKTHAYDRWTRPMPCDRWTRR
jgi:hypothetical protein